MLVKENKRIKPPYQNLGDGSNPEKQIFRPKVRIVGIGGGGSSIISEIAQKVKKASFAVIDTGVEVLKQLPRRIKRFRFNAKSEEKAKNLFEEIDFCIFVSCLGGKTGSNISPMLAEISRRDKVITLGIFILPFEFEGEKKMEIAKSSFRMIRPHLNASIIISNQNLFKLVDKNTSIKKALSVVNERVTANLEGLIEMIYSPMGTVSEWGLSPINFTDFKTILAGKGRLAFLNTVKAEISSPIHGVARKVVYDRLSPYLVYKAKRILFNIIGGKNLSLNEVNQIGSIITNLVNPRAKIIFGITQNEKYEDKISITLLATGCQWKDE